MSMRRSSFYHRYGGFVTDNVTAAHNKNTGNEYEA